MSKEHVEITFGRETVTMTCDLSQASAPIIVDGEETQYQTADARHYKAEAVRLAASFTWPDVRDWGPQSDAWARLAYSTITEGRAL